MARANESKHIKNQTCLMKEAEKSQNQKVKDRKKEGKDKDKEEKRKKTKETAVSVLGSSRGVQSTLLVNDTGSSK